jgi:hypothetical protein
VVVIAVVHNMDSPEPFFWRLPQMREGFAAFAAMLHDRAAQRPER